MSEVKRLPKWKIQESCLKHEAGIFHVYEDLNYPIQYCVVEKDYRPNWHLLGGYYTPRPFKSIEAAREAIKKEEADREAESVRISNLRREYVY